MLKFTEIEKTIQCKCGENFTQQLGHPRHWSRQMSSEGSLADRIGVKCPKCQNFISASTFFTVDELNQYSSSINNIYHL